MTFLKRLKIYVHDHVPHSGAGLTRLGLVLLIAASLWKWFAERHTTLSPDVADGTVGFAYGLTIATLLLGIMLRARERSQGRGRCA